MAQNLARFPSMMVLWYDDPAFFRKSLGRMIVLLIFILFSGYCFIFLGLDLICWGFVRVIITKLL